MITTTAGAPPLTTMKKSSSIVDLILHYEQQLQEHIVWSLTNYLLTVKKMNCMGLQLRNSCNVKKALCLVLLLTIISGSPG